MTKFIFAKKPKHLLFSILLICELMSRASFIYVKGSESSGRIVNGSTTNIGNAKFAVNLRLSGKFICGGTSFKL